jgi:hypothetical protein
MVSMVVEESCKGLSKDGQHCVLEQDDKEPRLGATEAALMTQPASFFTRGCRN